MKGLFDKFLNPPVTEFEGIPVEVCRRRVRNARVEFKPDHLKVIVPSGTNPMNILVTNKDSIVKRFHKYKDQYDTARKIPMVDWEIEEFAAIVNNYLEHYSHILKVRISALKFRKMRRRWGSCSSDGLITLNLYLQFVPEHLIAYIVYHELCHLLVRGHGPRFKRLIADEFPHYRQLDKELNLYGLKLLR